MWFVELVRTLAWPVTVVVVSAVFKPDILKILPQLVRRSMKLEALGFKAEVGEAEKQQERSSPNNTDLLQKNLFAPNTRPASMAIEDHLSVELNDVDPLKREAVLLRNLANSKLMRGHEFVYNRIFGSQIAALKRLNEIDSVSIADAVLFFQNYAEKYPDLYSTYSFEKWINFAIANNLIDKTEDRLKITVFGRDFLMYIVENALTENKPW